MTDFWADLSTPEPTPATPKPARPVKATPPADLGTVPFPDAWLVFRAGDDGKADDVRVVRGSHLNRIKPGEMRDWSHDIHLLAFGATPELAWQGFLQSWGVAPAHLAEAMRQAARVAGLEWLHASAAVYEEARAA